MGQRYSNGGKPQRRSPLIKGWLAGLTMLCGKLLIGMKFEVGGMVLLGEIACVGNSYSCELPKGCGSFTGIKNASFQWIKVFVLVLR